MLQIEFEGFSQPGTQEEQILLSDFLPAHEKPPLCLRQLAFSGWNPAPAARKLVGASPCCSSPVGPALLKRVHHNHCSALCVVVLIMMVCARNCSKANLCPVPCLQG